MKPNEAADCIGLLRALWPQVASWEDRRIDEMQRAFRLLNYSMMTMTLRAMNDDPRWEFPPRWADIFDEYNHTERAFKQRRQAIAAGDGMAPHEDYARYPIVDHRTLRPSGLLAKIVIQRLQAEVAKLSVPVALHDHTRSDYVNSCPVCSLHDHAVGGRHVAECQRCENLDIVGEDLLRTRYFNNPRFVIDAQNGRTLADEWRDMDERGETIPVRFLPDRSIW